MIPLDIKKIVNQLKNKYLTSNPFEIAQCMNILIIIQPLGRLAGCYMYKRRNRVIFLNSDIENEYFMREVMAHELGHAVMHRTQNCYFIQNKTYLLNSKIEKQANEFAADLLLPDNIFYEYQGYTIEQLSIITGYSKELVSLKLK